MMYKVERNVNLDLLKIIAMIMVICLHYLSRQGFLYYDFGTLMYFFCWLIYSACVCCVDVFVLITGYFMCCKPFSSGKHLNKVIKTLLTTQICSVFVGLLCVCFFKITFNLKDIIFTFFPVITNTNWFISSYVLLLIMSPFLDKFVCNLSKKRYKLLLLVLFFCLSVFPSISLQYHWLTKIQLGVSALFAFLYLLGGYIRKFGCTICQNKLIIAFLIMVLLLSVSKYTLDYLILNFSFIQTKLGPELVSQYSSKFFEYSSPIVIGEALLVFLIFMNLKLNFKLIINKIIVSFAACSLSVYVCHEQVLIRNEILWNVLVKTDLYCKTGTKFDLFVLPFMIIYTAIIIYVACSFLHFFIIKYVYNNRLYNLFVVQKIVYIIEKSKIYKLYLDFVMEK